MSDLKPKLSIIFPIFNNEKYLHKCITSVLNQTLKEIELILIDDGSTDKSPMICDELAAVDNRIRVVHKENAGAAAAQNQGLDMARGEYVAIVETDDSVAENMYEVLYDRARKTDADIVKCGFYYNESGQLYEATFFYSLAAENEVFSATEKPEVFLYHSSMWAAIYRRRFLDDHHLRCIETPSATYCDFSWMVMTYTFAKRITVYHAPLYYYTYDNPASSRVQQGERTFYKPYHCMESNRILREAGIYDAVKEEVSYHEFRTCLGHAGIIRKDLRAEYFARYNALMQDIDMGGVRYTRFSAFEHSLAKRILNNEIRRFYLVIDVRMFIKRKLSSYAAIRQLLWKRREKRNNRKMKI